MERDATLQMKSVLWEIVFQFVIITMTVMRENFAMKDIRYIRYTIRIVCKGFLFHYRKGWKMPIYRDQRHINHRTVNERFYAL